MNRLLFLFLIFSSPAVAQELKLVKATKQTINAGASPTSTTTYIVRVSKTKSAKLAIDSVVNVYTNKSNPFNVVMVDDPDLSSPDYRKVNVTEIKGKGILQITFSASKNRGSGRPGTPMNLMVPVAEFTQGAIIYYHVGKKKKQLVVETFEELETINAP